MKTTDLSLDSVAGGALPEKFEHQLRKVLENIVDPNTEAKEKRIIDIRITLRPGEDRVRVDAEVEVRARLAGPRSDHGQVFLGAREGEVVAVTYDPEQADLFKKEKGGDVTPLRLQKGEA